MSGLAWLPKTSLGLTLVPLAALLVGLGLLAAGNESAASMMFVLGTAPVLCLLVVQSMRLIASGNFGLDIIAGLAMAAALVAGETIAAIVVALMYSGGRALEAYAQGRAAAEMTALIARVPRTAERHGSARLETVPIEVLVPGDLVLVRRGDVIPADGTVAAGTAVLDESALTGEPLPLRRESGEPVLSGATNAGESFDLLVTRRAADSSYAGVVRMVEEARRSKAPLGRIADRFGLIFLALTLGVAGAAWWLSGDFTRAVAVLVIATPCPLILAVPVALVAGMSRCAGRGVMIKTARALERLPGIRTILVDKTGTVTGGEPKVVAVEPGAGEEPDELLRLAASLAQASHHVIAAALVAEAYSRGLTLVIPAEVAESPGEGVSGTVEARHLRMGRLGFALGSGTETRSAAGEAPLPPGVTAAHVAIDGREAGRILFADRIRPEASRTFERLRALGVARIVLVTGDRRDVADKVAATIGADAVVADATPEAKVAVAREEQLRAPTLMIGDGINDAPVLASAEIGVAMGARGAAAASEAADMIVMVDSLDRIPDAIAIAAHARHIALQSVALGLALSLIGMAAAATGHLPPVAGALLQEGIDLLAILNALRALGSGDTRQSGLSLASISARRASRKGGSASRMPS